MILGKKNINMFCVADTYLLKKAFKWGLQDSSDLQDESLMSSGCNFGYFLYFCWCPAMFLIIDVALEVALFVFLYTF